MGQKWDIQLPSADFRTGSLESVQIIDVAIFVVTREQIQEHHRANRKVICYMNAGASETWMEDNGKFPPSAVGNGYDGYPEERWLDVRDRTVRKIMQDRILLARDIGCDAIDPDNVDGSEQETGFPLTAADSLDFIKFLAQFAHDQGLAFGLKNYVDHVAELADLVDFAVNESCTEFGECAKYKPLLEMGKPVFAISYEDKAAACKDAADLKLDMLHKDKELSGSLTERC